MTRRSEPIGINAPSLRDGTCGVAFSIRGLKATATRIRPRCGDGEDEAGASGCCVPRREPGNEKVCFRGLESHGYRQASALRALVPRVLPGNALTGGSALCC